MSKPESMNRQTSEVWKYQRINCFSVLIGHPVGRYLLSTSCMAGHSLTHWSLVFGVCGGFYKWQTGLGAGHVGGQRGHHEGPRQWTVLCHLALRGQVLSLCSCFSGQWPSLTVPLPRPPEKKDLEKFWVKSQPSNSTVCYSK